MQNLREKKLEILENLIDENFGVCYQINEIFFWKFSYDVSQP